MMSVTSTETLTILLLSLFIQVWKYRAKVLIHPSLYFLAVWILSVISYEIHLAIGFDYILKDRKLVNELFLFVSFNAICFAFFGWSNRHMVRLNTIHQRVRVHPNLFFYYSWFFFLISVFSLFFLSGFDVAKNRYDEIEAGFEFAKSGRQFGVLELILNIVKALSLPFTIYGGLLIGNAAFYNKGKLKFVYFLPFLATIFTTISGGGRAGIAISFTFLLLGLFISLFSSRSNHLFMLRRVAIYFLVFITAFTFYTSFVNIERSNFKDGRGSGYDRWLRHPGLAPMAGVLEYLTDHFLGYQMRRNDIFTRELEYGQTTFACFTMFKVPVLSQLLREDVSIQNMFELKSPDTRKDYLLYEKRGYEQLGLTATVYFILYDDFGFYGVFISIFLFTWYTSRVFSNLWRKPIVNFWDLLPFVVVYILWTETIFSHHLSGAWLNIFIYPILVIEVLNFVFKVGAKPAAKELSHSPI